MTITRSSKFLVHSVAVFFSLLCVGHVVSGRVFAAQSSPAKQGADQSGAPDDPFKKPLTLESYKSFYVGGERVKRPDGTLGMTGHLYVEAFIPVNAKSTPIVMLHTTTSGTNFLGRANGEEGWATMFARAGYPVYVIDPPGTGRAGVDLTVNDKSKIKQGDSAEWASRKHGPEFGKAGFNPDPKEDSTPHSDPMNQMPTDTDGVNNWLAMQMTYSFDLGRRVRNAALIALLEKIGRPVIWMGWSGGGELAQQLVLERPELFKAIAHIEGCRQTPDIPAFIDTVAARHIPVLHVNADYSKSDGAVSGAKYLPSASRCMSPVDVAAEIRKKGGNALTIYLPELGIRGNGHEFMLQNNADRIARIYVDWLGKNVK